MNKKRNLYVLLITAISIVGISTFFVMSSPVETIQGEGFSVNRTVSHGLGSINGELITNSYEAFITNYAQGHRVFEIDLLFTEDDVLIARHDWEKYLIAKLGLDEVIPADRQGSALSYDEFKQHKMLGKYEPLAWSDVLELMVQYPDIYIITDTKQIEPDEFNHMFERIIHTAQAIDPTLLDRIVPQIYNEPMLAPLREMYDFPSIIYTLYTIYDTDEQVIEFVRANGIDVVTVSNTRITKNLVTSLNKLGVPTYVHTIDDEEEIKKFKKMGVYGFYTNSLTEEEVMAVPKGWFGLGF